VCVILSFCVRWVSHPKSAVREVSWRSSLLVIKYFAALYLANGSSRRIVKIEHYCPQTTVIGSRSALAMRSAK